MKTQYTQLQSILPVRLRELLPQSHLQELTEIRMRLCDPMKLVYLNRTEQTGSPITQEDLNFCVNTACRYSPWNAESVKQGYLTAAGGHRIGLCGEAAGGSIRSVRSVCIRVAKDLRGISDRIPIQGSVLIIGAPGAGKTTLLRDYVRRLCATGDPVSVVDERFEIFPYACGKPCFDLGQGCDVLSGMPKKKGIECVLRSMGPKWIVLDEITAPSDCDAMVQALWCGVKVIATAHAAGIRDLISRPVYRPIIDSGVFTTVVVMHPDKTYHLERITK